jgi:hypothetical protein
MAEKAQVDIIKLIQDMPKRKLSEIEKQLIFILIEKSKVHRERSKSNYDKVFMFFALFVVIAFLSNLNGLINTTFLNWSFIFGLFILFIVTWNYHSDLKKEEDQLEKLLEDFLK